MVKEQKFYQSGLSTVAIVLLGLTFVAGVTVLAIVAKNLASPKPTSTPTEAQEPSRTISQKSPKPSVAASPTASPEPELGKGVTVETTFRADSKALIVDFIATNFNTITSIYYNLNYDTDELGSIRGVEGTITTSSSQISGLIKNKSYIRRELVFGVCSKGICRYDRNPRNFKLTVTTTVKSGRSYTQTLYPK